MRNDPKAIVPIRQASMAPNTRPIASSGVNRWMIVSMLTSTSGLASPRSATAAKDRGWRRPRSHEQQRQRPQDDASGHVSRQSAAACPRDGNQTTDDRAHTEHRVEETNAFSADAEHLDSHHHEKYGRGPGDDRLGGDHQDDDGQVTVGEDRTKAVGELDEEALLLFDGLRVGGRDGWHPVQAVVRRSRSPRPSTTRR